MHFGYPLYIFTLISLDLLSLGHAHVIPKGYYLSNSCQPRCKSGTTCVVYRTDDGTPNFACKNIDPQKAVLDGTLIIPSQNIDKGSGIPSTDASRGSITNSFDTLFKPLPDTGVDTVKLNTNIDKGLGVPNTDASRGQITHSFDTLFQQLPDTGVDIATDASRGSITNSFDTMFKPLPDTGVDTVKLNTNIDKGLGVPNTDASRGQITHSFDTLFQQLPDTGVDTATDASRGPITHSFDTLFKTLPNTGVNTVKLNTNIDKGLGVPNTDASRGQITHSFDTLFKTLPNTGVNTVKLNTHIHKGSGVPNTDASRGPIANSFDTLFKPLPDTGVDTVKAINTNIVEPRHSLIDHTGVISNTLQHDQPNRFSFLGKTPDIFSANDFSRNSEHFPSFQNVPSTKNNDTNNKKSKFEGITLVRTAGGGVAFRRIGKADSSQRDKKLDVIPQPKQKKAESSPIQKWKNDGPAKDKHVDTSTFPQHSEQKKIDAFSGVSTACKPCNPDHACPAKNHCYYSVTCARQICQPL